MHHDVTVRCHVFAETSSIPSISKFRYMVKNAERIQMWNASIQHSQNELVEKDQAFGFS